MVSVRTEYRIKRVETIRSCIDRLEDMLLLNGLELERISLPALKNLQQLLSRKDKKTYVFHKGL